MFYNTSFNVTIISTIETMSGITGLYLTKNLEALHFIYLAML